MDKPDIELEVVYDMEVLAEAVHKAYCDYYKSHNADEYWTKGDYSLLNEETKQIDRETVMAVLTAIPKIEFISPTQYMA